MASTAARPPQRLVRSNAVNLRLALLRVPLNGFALSVAVLILPGVHVQTSRPVLGYLALGAIFGLLNAVVKPLLQLVALPFLFSSFGLVLLIVDGVVFGLLSLTRMLGVDHLWSLFVGGAVVGLLGFVLENVLGLTEPIVPEER